MVRPDVVVVNDREPGKGCALRAGVEAATGDYVVMLDADGSMDPADIDRFIAALDAGHDLVKGSRFLPDGGTADMTPLRDVGNKGLLLVSNILFRRRHTDLCYGFAGFRRGAFQDLRLTARGFEIEAQLFLRATRHGLRVTEIASFEAPRRYGNSNLNTFRDGWRVLRTILWERVRIAAAPRQPRPRARPLQRLDAVPMLLPTDSALGGAPPPVELPTTVSIAPIARPAGALSKAAQPLAGAIVPADPRADHSLDHTGDGADPPDGLRARRAPIGRVPVGHNVPD
jgi:hypothetical protein